MNIIGQQIVLIAVMFDGSGIHSVKQQSQPCKQQDNQKQSEKLVPGQNAGTAGAKTIAASMVSNV